MKLIEPSKFTYTSTMVGMSLFKDKLLGGCAGFGIGYVYKLIYGDKYLEQVYEERKREIIEMMQLHAIFYEVSLGGLQVVKLDNNNKYVKDVKGTYIEGRNSIEEFKDVSSKYNLFSEGFYHNLYKPGSAGDFVMTHPANINVTGPYLRVDSRNANYYNSLGECGIFMECGWNRHWREHGGGIKFHKYDVNRWDWYYSGYCFKRFDFKFNASAVINTTKKVNEYFTGVNLALSIKITTKACVIISTKPIRIIGSSYSGSGCYKTTKFISTLNMMKDLYVYNIVSVVSATNYGFVYVQTQENTKLSIWRVNE